MQAALRNEDYLHLTYLLTEKNKEFTSALKERKSQRELQVIYEDLTALFDAIKELKKHKAADPAFLSIS